MKKILFITSNTQLPWGGSEVLWSRCASALASGGGVRIGALLRSWEPVPEHVRQMAADGVEIIYRPEAGSGRLPRHQAWLNRVLPYKRQYKLPTAANPLSPIAVFEPDVVVQSCGHHVGVLGVAEYCQALDISYAHIIQLVSEVHYTDDEVTDRLVESYNNASLNCFISRHNVELAERMLGCALPNVRMVRNPGIVRGELLAYPPVEPFLRAACPGRLHSLHKGQDLLLEVLGQANWRSRGLAMDFYGDGPNRSQLERLKCNWGLKRVTFHGSTSDIAGVWKDHHLFISASRMEAQPMTLVEAMACGRVAVATDVGSARELIDDGVNGFIAEAATAYHLDQAMERAWERREDWETMGKAAHKKAMEYLTPDPVEELCDMIKELL